MGISLSKGSNINLSKAAPGLAAVHIGLGWKPRVTDGEKFDLDASAFLLANTGKVRSGADFIFYGQLKSADGTVEHTGDNRTGDGDGDDETININLAGLSSDIDKIAFSVTIHEADKRKQSFGQVSDAYIRIINQDGGVEIARYDLSEDASTETAMIFGELYRADGEWKFRAIEQGFTGGLAPLASGYGVEIDG